jgi:hypothetical protein
VLDELEQGLIDVNVGTDRAVAAAKRAAAEGDWRRAMEILLCAAEKAGDQVTLRLPHIRKMREFLKSADDEADEQQRSYDKLARELSDTRTEQRVMRRELTGLQQQFNRADLAREKILHEVLLGQAAYTFASLVEQFVFQGADTGQYVPLSLKEMAQMHQDGELSEDQSARWQALPTILPQHVPLQQLLKTDKYLRQLRYQPAHGSRDQHERATLDELMHWTEQHAAPAAVGPVKQLLTILNTFSSRSRPLCPDKKLTIR